MLSLCHIFHDNKFVDHSLDLFQSNLFINNPIFIGNDKSYDGKYKHLIQFIDPEDYGINNAVKMCCKYDVIIFYNLDYYKSIIVNRLPKGIKKVWFFYGTEFYSMPKHELACYSDKTKDSLNINKYYYMKTIVFNILRMLKYNFRIKMTPIAEFNTAVKKIDYFLWFDKDGYSNIKKYWKSFPKLIEIKTLKLTETKTLMQIENRSTLNNKIVIGNSRAPENNSLDIIDLFENYLSAGNISLLFPLSYGKRGKYYFDLMNRIRYSHINIKVLDDLLPYDVYVKKIIDAKAAVINSYRPMAQGNVFLFLGNGVKLYLSERNPSYNWLRSLGFIISSVETNLKNDIINNALSLSTHQAERNRSLFSNLSDDRSVINFHDNFYKLFQ